MFEVRDCVMNYMYSSFDPSRDAYFVLLYVFHEDMHDEALFITTQTLGYPFPAALQRSDAPPVPVPETSDVSIPGGEHTLGSTAEAVFISDTDNCGHTLSVHSSR